MNLNLVSKFVSVLFLTLTSLNVTANSDVKSQTREPVLRLSDVITEQQFQTLVPEEQAEIQSELAEFNKNPYVLVADSSNNIWIKAFCIGGKAALVAFGIQGFKCVTTGKRIVTVTMSGDRHSSAVTGLLARGYAGLNAGVSVLAGVAVFSCPAGECGDLRGRYYRDEGYINGGTVNGAFGPYGGYVGYYSRGNSTVSIVAYQAGLAVEIAASQIQVD